MPDPLTLTKTGLCISFDDRGLYNTHGQVKSHKLIKSMKGTLDLDMVKVIEIGDTNSEEAP